MTHADYMVEQMEKLLARILLDYPAKMVAEMAGCSRSLIYQWSNRGLGMDNAAAKYMLALIAQLAERGDFSGIYMLLPQGAVVEERHDQVEAVDGSTDDELAEMTHAMSHAGLAHKGRNPEQMAAAIAEARAVLRRLEEERNALLAQQGGTAH